MLSTFYRSYPRLVQTLLIVLIFTWCWVNYWLIQWLFDKSYFSWYVKSGSLIALGTAMFSLVWKDFEKNTGLISRNPLEYIGSVLQLVGLPLITLGTYLDSNKRYQSVSAFDLWLAIPFFLVTAVGLMAWLMLIAPMQYFVYLLCGASARLIIASNTKLRVEVKSTGKISWDTSLQDKPVGVTNIFSAFLLANINFWIS